MLSETRRLFALAGPLLLAVPAAANSDLLGLGPDLLAKIAAAPGASGSGNGMMQMPKTDCLGRLHATMEDSLGKFSYIVDADLCIYLPAAPGDAPRVQFGGLYGTIDRVLNDKGDLERIGLVDGLWTLENNLTGEFDALVWRRNAVGTMEIGGLIEAGYRVHDTMIREEGGQLGIWIGGPPVGGVPPQQAVGREGVADHGGVRDVFRPTFDATAATQQQAAGGRQELGEMNAQAPSGSGSGSAAGQQELGDRSGDVNAAGKPQAVQVPIQVRRPQPPFVFQGAGQAQAVNPQQAPGSVSFDVVSAGAAAGMNVARRQRQKPASDDVHAIHHPSWEATAMGPQQADGGRTAIDTTGAQDTGGGSGLDSSLNGQKIGDRSGSIGRVGTVHFARAAVQGGGQAQAAFRFEGAGQGQEGARELSPGNHPSFAVTPALGPLQEVQRQAVRPGQGEEILERLVGPAVLRFKLID